MGDGLLFTTNGEKHGTPDPGNDKSIYIDITHKPKYTRRPKTCQTSMRCLGQFIYVRTQSALLSAFLTILIDVDLIHRIRTGQILAGFARSLHDSNKARDRCLVRTRSFVRHCPKTSPTVYIDSTKDSIMTPMSLKILGGTGRTSFHLNIRSFRSTRGIPTMCRPAL